MAWKARGCLKFKAGGTNRLDVLQALQSTLLFTSQSQACRLWVVVYTAPSFKLLLYHKAQVLFRVLCLNSQQILAIRKGTAL